MEDNSMFLQEEGAGVYQVLKGAHGPKKVLPRTF